MTVATDSDYYYYNSDYYYYSVHPVCHWKRVALKKAKMVLAQLFMLGVLAY